MMVKGEYGFSSFKGDGRNKTAGPNGSTYAKPPSPNLDLITFSAIPEMGS